VFVISCQSGVIAFTLNVTLTTSPSWSIAIVFGFTRSSCESSATVARLDVVGGEMDVPVGAGDRVGR
jgi:hypothetical protein